MYRRLDLTSLDLFVAVCESRSLTHAAESRHLTVSAVSKRLAKLEQFTGNTLLIRTHSGVEPTNDGIRLLEHARTILPGIEALEREMSIRESNLRGCVRIFANRSANAEFVPVSVAAFLANPRHRHIDVQIGEMTSHEVISGVKAGLASVGVCWADADMEGVEWRLSGRDSLSAVVPADHPLAKRKQVSFAETLDYEQVGIHSGGPVTNRLRRESVRARKSIRYRVVAPTFDAMIRFIEARLVIAIMPSKVAFRCARNAAVTVVPLSDEWKERQFAVCCRNRRALPGPAAELFRHLVVEG